MNTAQLLFNPAAGSFSENKADAILSMVRNAGINFRAHYPSTAIEAKELVRQITQQTAEPFIIAVGGDGTVNTVLNGIANSRTLLGYIPLGTANVLARELAISSSAEAVSRIKNGAARSFTVGKLIGQNESFLFLSMAGIGFDGAVVASVRHQEKKVFGKGAYLLSALRQLRTWDRSQITVEADGESFYCHTVIVCNAAHYGGNFRIAPGASIFSPTLTILGTTDCRRKEFTLWAIKIILNSKMSSSQRGWSRQVSRVVVSGNKAVQLDGDAAGQTPASIIAIPSFARILA